MNYYSVYVLRQAKFGRKPIDHGKTSPFQHFLHLNFKKYLSCTAKLYEKVSCTKSGLPLMWPVPKLLPR